MRIPLIAGNWKMNKSPQEAKEFAQALVEALLEEIQSEVLICPPFTALSVVAEVIKNSNIRLGAQNMHWEIKGAFTGEISGEFLKELGCQYVILGHSERRQYFAETDEIINKKLHTALQIGLKPILCIGETLAERENNQTLSVVKRQLETGLKTLDNINNVVIAYEPVWAIGTGKTATPDQAEEIHSYIRENIAKKWSKDSADKIRILYGGSVTPENIDILMTQPDIDGVLVGGASLRLESFIRIIKFRPLNV
ncbi:MAG: triose-phosphate isomerase [candidate division WOR-3 bacterium]|nr:triose-phosphate isomerase [candidate division WOR-3 bacterium]